MNKRVLAGVLAAAVMATLAGTRETSAAQAGPRLWSVMAHFEYADGFNYDYPLARGVTTPEMSAILQDCGSSHRTPSVVRYHCYPVPE
jgi:hypothetical protein